jgi:phosphoribosylcarboxyaminoimidazole (NCAIR) mutase
MSRSMSPRTILARAGYLAAVFALAVLLFGLVGMAAVLLLSLPALGVPARTANAAGLLAAMLAAQRPAGVPGAASAASRGRR